MDYFVVAMRGDDVQDYLGLEVQSLDTTGSGAIWKARRDLEKGMLRQRYNYGINWRMTAKTALLQLYHKALWFEAHRRKLVVVLQREFFEYLADEFHMEHVRALVPDATVYFHVYSLVERDNGLGLSLTACAATNAAGVALMFRPRGILDASEKFVLAKVRRRLTNSIRLRTYSR